MYSPLTDDYDLGIRSGAQRVSYVDVYYPVTATTPILSNVAIESFSIRADRKSDIRRTGTVVINDEELLNILKITNDTSPLEPYGAEFRIMHGLKHADGSEELIPVGVFHAEDLSYDNPGSLIKISLVDRSRVLKRKMYGFPRDAGGQLATAVISHPVTTLLPYAGTVQFEDGLDDLRIPGGTQHRGDMLSICQDTAASMAGEFFFDAEGVPRVNKIPTLDISSFAGVADWDVDCGEEGVLISAASTISRKDTYNRVLVIGVNPSENTEAVYADIQDNDPRSLTYYYGNFGQVDKWIEDSNLTTYTQCITRANAELNNSKGLSYTLALETLSNPALDLGDILKVTLPDRSIQYHLVDSFGIDHTGQMSISTRTEQR